MGKKQVVSEPQVLLSCWEFILLLFSRSAFEGLRVVVKDGLNVVTKVMP